MKIELYSADKLSQKGSTLKKMIQNNNMPILDLLVRESIQNSLDAKDGSSRSRYVEVGYNVGVFDVKKLDRELEDVSLLNNPHWGNRYLSISDKHTVGLTGKYDDKKSNLYKLVFGIMDAQQAAGAGGAWGIGKTVYFRIGVGMVIYYSRIKSENGFKSLLTAAFVEDETADSAILPAVKGHKYGIAWWGEKVSPRSSSIRETCRLSTICRVLDAFGITPYQGNETGTVIIIPFIDEASLLNNNQPAREAGNPGPYWLKNMKDFLRVSVQKWYSARLNNKSYPYGKYLHVSICGKVISPDDMDPFFKLTQQLYNKAALSTTDPEKAQQIQIAGADINCFDIRIYSEITPNEAGYVSCVKLSRKDLGMTPPMNYPSPYEYISSNLDEEIQGRPIMLFCRQPGMVVSYETEGKWVSSIPVSADDEYVIAWFVLNPDPVMAKVGSNRLTLEEYVRKSEMADHSSWEDYAIEDVTPSVISKIKRSVARKVGGVFEVIKDDESKSEDTGLSNLLGRILLPPEGFGRRPSSPRPGGGGGGYESRNMKYRYTILSCMPSGLRIRIDASSGNKTVSSFGFSLEMQAVSGSISALAWESEIGLSLPFCIKSVHIIQSRIDGILVGVESEVERCGGTICGKIKSNSMELGSGEWYGNSFSFIDGEKHSVEVSLTLEIEVHRKDVNPSLSFE